MPRFRSLAHSAEAQPLQQNEHRQVCGIEAARTHSRVGQPARVLMSTWYWHDVSRTISYVAGIKPGVSWQRKSSWIELHDHDESVDR